MNRRTFLKGAGVAAAATCGGPAARELLAGEAADKPGRPNIVVILVDDLGYGDLACYGAKDLRTPHIDALAAAGMRWDRFYANCPVCSPTRASLLTGRFPPLVGVPGVVRTHDNNNWGHLARSAVLLPQVLTKAGYDTAIVGKWHLGLEEPNTPNDRGFAHFHGFLGDMMDDYYTHRRHDINYMRLNRQTIDPKGHATDLFTQWAVEYLAGRPGKDKPFFLYLAYNAPHTPIQPPQEWLDKVTAREPNMTARRAKLAALIEHMDDGVGKVIAELKRTGLYDNTLIVFVSDNGGQEGVGASNGPLRAGKGTLYEGGLRVPMCAAWTGHIAPGSKSDRVALTMDLFATAADAAGAKVNHEIDGRTILPTLLGKTQPPEDRLLFFNRREGGRPFGGKTIECVRKGELKLLRSRPGGALEMYDLAADPAEQKDLLAGGQTHPQYAALAAALEEYYKRTEAISWRRPVKQ